MAWLRRLARAREQVPQLPTDDLAGLLAVYRLAPQPSHVPCTAACPAWRLADVFDACGRPRVQEMVSEDSWHLFLRRRASTPWSSFGRRGSRLSAMRARGGLRMSGMGASDLCEGPCSFVQAVCVPASACSRKYHCGFSRVLCAFVTFVIFVVPACRIESISIPLAAWDP